MNTNLFIAYDNADEIFYNNKYLDILKSKDYVLGLKHGYEKNTYQIVDKPENNTSKEKSKFDKLIDIVNQSRIINFSDIRISIWKFKYMMDAKVCIKANIQCFSCNCTCLSFNYILKKYAKPKIINKNILIISHINYNLTYYTTEKHGTLFNPYQLYLFNTCKNLNIYSIINIENSDKYKKTVINKENNNTYHLLTCDTNGNIMDKKTFDIIMNRLNNIVFDCVVVNNINDIYMNNIILIYMYIIKSCSSTETKTIFRIPITDKPFLIKLCSNIYNHSYIMQPKTNYLLYYENIYILCTDINTNSDEYKNIDIVLDVLSTNKYINMESNEAPKYITKFFDKIYDKAYKFYKILYSILRISHKNEYTIIIQTIDTKQRYYAQQNKYIKYNNPFKNPRKSMKM